MEPTLRTRAQWVGTALVVSVVGSCVLAAGRRLLTAGGGPSETDVAYGEAGGQKLLLDVHRPPGPQDPNKRLPAVILVHGGGWSSGSKQDYAEMAPGLALQGYVCFSTNYRLVNGATNQYPACYDDVQRAVRWVRAHASRYQVDPKRVGALGGSAGGHLVALLGTTDTRDNSDPALRAYSSRVACVVDMCGPTDFTPAFSRNALGHDIQALVEGFLGKRRGDDPALYRQASPLFNVDGKTVPFLIFHGADDPIVPVDQSRRLHEALQKAGRESELVVFEGEGHGFERKEHQDEFIRKTVAFLDRHLK